MTGEANTGLVAPSPGAFHTQDMDTIIVDIVMAPACLMMAPPP